MGYFSFGAINFIYKIYRSKRFRKFLMGFGFLAFVLFTIFNNTTFAAQDDAQYTTDSNIAILEYYDSLDSVFQQCFNKYYGKNTNYTNNFNNLFTQVSSQGYIPFFSYNSNEDVFNVYIYRPKNFNSLADDAVTTDYVINDYYRVPCTGYNVTFSYYTSFNYDQFNTLTSTTTTRFVPTVLYNKLTDRFYECMQAAGYTYGGSIYSIQQEIHAMRETMEDIDESINEEPSDEETNSDLQNIVVDNTTDVTSAGFNTIFETIRNGFVNPTNNSVSITIPFTNKSFTISRNAIYGGLYNNIRNSLIGQLITTFWWFVLGIFVYKDIGHIINKVKSGEIEGIATTNIKEDLL